MIKTKELVTYDVVEKGIDVLINEFINKTPNVKIVDIKYCSRSGISAALIIYSDGYK